MNTIIISILQRRELRHRMVNKVTQPLINGRAGLQIQVTELNPNLGTESYVQSSFTLVCFHLLINTFPCSVSKMETWVVLFLV